MSDSNGKGYYIFYGYPDELKTDQQYTYKMATSTDGDMTDVTYSFGWSFTCDGVTTEDVVASGLTSLTYTWAPSSVIFGPLMSKSKSGILKVIVKTSTGQMTYISRDITLTISDSIRPSISNCVIGRTDYAYNDKSISNRTMHNLTVGVSGLYGASQTVVVSVGDTTNTITVDAKAGNQISTASLELGTFDAGTADSVEKTVNITVTDSRGFTTNGTASVTVYGYTPPTLTASVYRDTNQDAYISFTTSYQGTVAGKANSINTFYARCTTGSTMVQTDLKTSPQKLNGTDALENSYNVFVLFMDDVGGKDIKRFVIPSATPVMDIGADGKTVTFFGTAPNSADNLSLQIKDVASFGEEIRLGKSSANRTIISNSGMSMLSSSNDEIIHFGYVNTSTASEGYYFSLGDDNGIQKNTSGYSGASCSFMAGEGLRSAASYQTVVGRYNEHDTSALFMVGSGNNDLYRSTAFKVSAAETFLRGSLAVCSVDESMYSSVGAALTGIGGSGSLTLYTNCSNPWTLEPNGSNFYVRYNYSTKCTLDSSGNIKASVIQSDKFQLTSEPTSSHSTIDCIWLDGSFHPMLIRAAGSNTVHVGAPANSYGGTQTITNIRGNSVWIKGTSIYLSSGAWKASDERLKKDFQPIDKWEAFFDNVEPCAFKFKNGTSGRYHLGFKAQQVKESLEKSGLTTKDFAGFVTDKYDPDKEDIEEIKLYHEIGINPGDDIHGLIYTEFIALQHNEIQKLKAKVKNLETEINDIKEMIKSKEE